MPEYGDHKYWDKRYQEQKTKTFDWLQDYSALKAIIEKICTKEAKILMLGCGNSLMSEEMYVDGYEHIYNIDISEIVIQQMKELHQQYTNMIYEVMDCTKLTYPDGFFDIVIDKSTIDALLCGSDPDLTVAKTTKEVQRVLKTSGVYCVISYGIPENRICHLKMPHLSFEVETMEVTKPEVNSKNINTHYVYLCKKDEKADKTAELKWSEVEEDLLLGVEKEITLKPKFLQPKGNELDGLSVKNEDYVGPDSDVDDLDDAYFLKRIDAGELNDKEIGQVLGDIKIKSEKLAQIEEPTH